MTSFLADFSHRTRARLLALCRDRFADPVHGGFHERLDAALAPLPLGRKRTMVQARQLYVLAHAALLGDRSGAEAAERGYAFLRRCCWDGQRGGWHFAVTPEGEALEPTRDLYAHAFALFALAWLHRAFAAPGALALAEETMAVLRARLAAPGGGFYATASAAWEPDRAALVQNPHMHLLEAMLALHAASGAGGSGADAWLAEADALVRLFKAHLFEPATGTLREYFAPGWRLDPERGGRVEPGHQFEWSWLLRRYAAAGGREPVAEEAARLYAFATRAGIDPQTGGIPDEVAPDGASLQPTRRIWPVAEALKASLAAGESARAEGFAAQLERDFLRVDTPGWYERLARDGTPTMTELPASTPYHLFFAAAEAGKEE